MADVTRTKAGPAWSNRAPAFSCRERPLPPQRRRRLIPAGGWVAIAACTAFLIGTFQAQAQEPVKTRGWVRSSYGRIVFDWPRPVGHRATIKGGELVVQFDRPMQTSLNAAVRALGDYVTGGRVSDDGRTAMFGLAGTYRMDSFVSGASVIVDLRRTGAAALRTTAPAPAQGLQVRVGQHPGFTRLVFDWGDSVDYTVRRDRGRVSMRFDRSAAVDLEALDKALPKPAFGTPTARAAGTDLIVDLVVPDQSYIRHFRDRGNIVLDVLNAGGDFGGLIAGDAVGGRMMEMITPSGEVLTVPAMVGSRVAVAPEGQIPLVTEDVSDVPAAAVPYQGDYTPLPHYDPNASAKPRSLLKYGKQRGRSINGS